MYEKLLTSYVDVEQEETRSLGIFVNGNLLARDRVDVIKLLIIRGTGHCNEGGDCGVVQCL